MQQEEEEVEGSVAVERGKKKKRKTEERKKKVPAKRKAPKRADCPVPRCTSGDLSDLPKHLQRVHKMCCPSEKNMFLAISRNRLNIDTCPCPVCGATGRKLRRHLYIHCSGLTPTGSDNLRKELESQAQWQEARRLMAELRAGPEAPFLVTDIDLEEHQEASGAGPQIAGHQVAGPSRPTPAPAPRPSPAPGRRRSQEEPGPSHQEEPGTVDINTNCQGCHALLGVIHQLRGQLGEKSRDLDRSNEKYRHYKNICRDLLQGARDNQKVVDRLKEELEVCLSGCLSVILSVCQAGLYPLWLFVNT